MGLKTLIAWAGVVILAAAGCNPSEQSESGAMLFFKKNKSDVTNVGAAVGAPLMKRDGFPDAQPVPVQAAVSCTVRGLKGEPPAATFAEAMVPGETTLAFVVDGSAQHPPLAVVRVQHRAELWEIEVGATPKFARKRSVRFDPNQDDWVTFSIIEVACLPGDRLLLAVEHHTPVRFGLYVYDIAANSCTKLSDAVSLGLIPEKRFESADTFFASQGKLFDLLLVSPDEMLVLFYSGEQRLAAELYYATPGHIYAFTPQHPQGVPVLRLSAADGVVERWLMVDKTLWLATQDFRDRKHPKSYSMSLDLGKLLAR